METADTIFALSSGNLPSGIAVVRVSGLMVPAILKAMCSCLPPPRRARLVRVREPKAGELIDTALVLFFASPESFTGEDTAEFHVHGGIAVVDYLLKTLSGFENTRPAEAGEFTRRAFTNGRLDLTEAEGLADLITAETKAQHSQAIRQAEGALRIVYEDWAKKLLSARALIEAEFDFADEQDVPDSAAEHIWDDVRLLQRHIAEHLVKGENGERLRLGVQTVVLGQPNAGKSSLINALAQRDVAIVTPYAGTTRDLIEVRLDLHGMPLTLIDTAGLRDIEAVSASEEIERAGIQRAEQAAQSADLIIWVSDATQTPLSFVPPEYEEKPALWLLNKVDKLEPDDLKILERRVRLTGAMAVTCSMTTGFGMDIVLRHLGEKAQTLAGLSTSPVWTRARHKSALVDLMKNLDKALEEENAPLEIRAEYLRAGGDALGRLSGRIDVEELLGVIFSQFCIGK